MITLCKESDTTKSLKKLRQECFITYLALRYNLGANKIHKLLQGTVWKLRRQDVLRIVRETRIHKEKEIKL